MLDLAWSEIVLIAVVALLVIGPKDLPGAIRGIADTIKKARRGLASMQQQADELVREAKLDDVRNQIAEVRGAISDIRRFDLKGEIEKAVDSDGTLKSTFDDPALSGGASASAPAWTPPPTARDTPDAPAMIPPQTMAPYKPPPAAAPAPEPPKPEAPAFVPPSTPAPPLAPAPVFASVPPPTEKVPAEKVPAEKVPAGTVRAETAPAPAVAATAAAEPAKQPETRPA